jgi:Fe2+ transport system protein FeoA
LDRLTALSLFPGSRLRVHQTFPAFVIRCGETDIALDREVAQDIYVRRIETEGEE